MIQTCGLYLGCLFVVIEDSPKFIVVIDGYENEIDIPGNSCD